MYKITDRLVILVLAATGFAVLIMGWAGGLVQAELGGFAETAVLGALVVLFVLALAAIWREFGRVDEGS